MFKYHVKDSANTIIEFDPESTNTWNKQPLLEAYRDDVDARGKGFIEDMDGFMVHGESL